MRSLPPGPACAADAAASLIAMPWHSLRSPSGLLALFAPLSIRLPPISLLAPFVSDRTCCSRGSVRPFAAGQALAAMPPRAQCGAPPTARSHLPAVRSRCEQRRDGAEDGGRRTCDRELRLRSAAKQPEPAVGHSRLGREGRRREQRFVPDPAPRARLARGAGCSTAWRATLQAVLAKPATCARVTVLARRGGHRAPPRP
ncbi:hypothetical protein ERJ75_000568700 [Trypanosoma vivax]|nr:hypothetical protein ERJ75_000568700 [Trypanosoma vivax]